MRKYKMLHLRCLKRLWIRRLFLRILFEHFDDFKLLRKIFGSSSLFWNFWQTEFIKWKSLKRALKEMSSKSDYAKVVYSQIIPKNIYLFKVENTNTIKRCEICSKLITKTPERRQWRRSAVFTVNFEYFSHLFPLF